jgi:hypothetical protein
MSNPTTNALPSPYVITEPFQKSIVYADIQLQVDLPSVRSFCIVNVTIVHVKRRTKNTYKDTDSTRERYVTRSCR